MKLLKSKWLLNHPEIKGVFVGGCVERGLGYGLRSKAHAHIVGDHRGWICFQSKKWLHVRELWLHELAHIVTRQGHTNQFRKFLLQIGGTLDPIVVDGKQITRSCLPRKRQNKT